MQLTKITLIVVTLVFAALGAGCATQAKTQASKMDNKNEMMAKMHDQMASCLRTGKSSPECRSEVQKNCPMMKDGTCPMMGEMKGSCHMMPGGMMMNPETAMEKKKSASTKKAESTKSKDKNKTSTEEHEEHH